MPTVEARVDTLESLLGQFIVHTDTALRRLEREMREFKDEMRAFKDEMREFKDEMREFKDEMREFKDEMREFKDEMREFKDTTGKILSGQSKRWGEIANKMGTLVEDIVAPNIPRIAREVFGCKEMDFFAVRIEKRDKKGNVTREFDVIAVCDKKVLLNETKSTPRQSYLEEFAEFVKSGKFFSFFPEYKGMKLVPIFSSLYLSDSVVEYLSKNKIYAMAMKGDTMDILNPQLKPQRK
ncbi:MAG TPA: hypothetical protein ENJ04_01635 [Nitrospirae bacterium]|nr:hypothetical protein [Nitrospirota bacterium]